jgi:hypothetical protein
MITMNAPEAQRQILNGLQLSLPPEAFLSSCAHGGYNKKHSWLCLSTTGFNY